jgi:putative membrane protein
MGIFLVLVALTWWSPRWPVEQALHSSLTVVALAALLAVHRRWPLPPSSFVLVLAFLAVHSVAARWIYSFVPYEQWLQDLVGVRPDGGRNHFDRLVHLTYGLCFGAVLFRHLADVHGWRAWRAAVVSVEMVLSSSALYELFEWLIAETLAPGAAEAYNGQQGDMWDAHKDMALATLGAAVAALASSATRRARTTGRTQGERPVTVAEVTGRSGAGDVSR